MRRQFDQSGFEARGTGSFDPSPFKRWMRLAALMSLVLVLYACGGDDASDTTTATSVADGDAEMEDVSVRLNINAYAPHAPFVVAADQGFYNEEGLEVSIGEGTGSDTTGALVAEGDDTFGLVDFSTLSVLIEEGAPIKSVAVFEQTSPLAIITKPDSEIQEPANLEGQRIVMEQGDVGIFEAFADATGFNPDEVEIVTLEDAAQAAALAEDRIDGIFGWTTYQLPQIEKLIGEAGYLLWADYGFNSLNLAIVAHNDLIEGDPEMVCSFVDASMRGFQYSLDNPDEAVSALMEAFPNVDEEIAEVGLEEQLLLLHTSQSESEPLGRALDEDIQSTLQLFTDTGQIEEPLETSAVYTNMCYE